MAEMKVKDNTQQVINETTEAIQRALIKCGGKMERYAKLMCPVDTGLLRNSITYVTATHAGSTFKLVENAEGGGTRFTSSSTGATRYGAQPAAETDEDNIVIVGTNVHYAPYVEFGGHKRKGKYFIRRAVTDHIDEYRKIIANELKKVTEK